MKPIALACLFSLAVAPAYADVSLGVGITVSGDAEIKNTTYDCGDAGKLAVQYLNAAPNFLALIPIKEQTLVFVPKILAIFVTLLLALPFMADALQSHMMRISSRIIGG